jgi:hypothetical protein
MESLKSATACVRSPSRSVGVGDSLKPLIALRHNANPRQYQRVKSRGQGRALAIWRPLMGVVLKELKFVNWAAGIVGHRLQRSELALTSSRIVVFVLAMVFIGRIKRAQEGRGFESKE